MNEKSVVIIPGTERGDLNDELNIITLNIPYPPDYGGMIDTYYRIKSLHDKGTDIHLHCFAYGRQPSAELQALCKTVSYYPRKNKYLSQFSGLPFIVSSRRSEILLEKLLKNDYPILFDGLHTACYINHPALADRKKYVRLHNIEHQYYLTLARHESNIIKKLYFTIESIRLKRFEKALLNATRVLPISAPEHDYFNNKYHNSVLIGPFHPFNLPEIQTGSGDYILYHGDLSVNENSVISELLISNVFSKIDYNCIIAGKNPPAGIKRAITGHTNIRLISDPGNEEIIKLINNAHINILPALSNNGLKIKLLYALFAGRHCLVNSVMTEGYNLAELCNIADTWEDMAEKISQLMQLPFTVEMVRQRGRILSENYNNDSNADLLIDLIFAD